MRGLRSRRRDCRTRLLRVDDPAAGERPVLPLRLLEDDHHIVRMQPRRALQRAYDVGDDLSLDFNAAAHGEQNLDQDEIVGTELQYALKAVGLGYARSNERAVDRGEYGRFELGGLSLAKGDGDERHE